MALLLRSIQRSSSSPNVSLQTLIHGLDHRSIPLQITTSTLFTQTRRTYISEIPKSPFESNLIRILDTEIQYQSEYAPLQPLVTKFNSVTVHDRPGEQCITLRGKFKDDDIKIEATMFDGCVVVQKHVEDSTGEDLRLHISLLVDIAKGEGSDPLEFVCSAWPDCLEIQKVYILREHKMLARPYLGTDSKAMNGKLKKALGDFLEARGVNAELCSFLHDYMMKKDRSELLRWLGKVKSFVEKL